ncbi:MAG: hypothetical protein RL367_79, partial [Pseudomonadota bacterium]
GNDPKHIASALGDVVRSVGTTELAHKTELGSHGLGGAWPAALR